MSELNRRHNYGLDLFLLSVDEGITGYRDDSLETVKRNEVQYGLPLKVVSYKDLYGWTMDEIVKMTGLKNNCTLWCFFAARYGSCVHELAQLQLMILRAVELTMSKKMLTEQEDGGTFLSEISPEDVLAYQIVVVQKGNSRGVHFQRMTQGKGIFQAGGSTSLYCDMWWFVSRDQDSD